MPFIPVPNCVQARLIFQEDNGLIAQNVFYHATTSAPTSGDMDLIGETWLSIWVAQMVTSVTTNWALTSVNMRAMNEEEGIIMNYSPASPISGTGSGPVPDQVTYTVTWSTGLIGRSARGRTYGIGLLAEAIQNRNRLTDAWRTSLTNGWVNIMQEFESVGHALQVVSFVEGGVPRVTGRKLPILAGSVRFPLATQRRRLS